MVKNPGRQKTQVRSQAGKIPLEEGMAAHSGTLAWRISWAEEPGRLQSIALQRLRHTFVPSVLNLPPTSHPFPSL